jgi:hypothetical protein
MTATTNATRHELRRMFSDLTDRATRSALSDLLEERGEPADGETIALLRSRYAVEWCYDSVHRTYPGKELASMSGPDIAHEFGIHYSGDMSVIPHDGFFYDVSNWEEYGYADCVEFCCLEERGEDAIVFVSRGTINRPTTDDEMRRVLGHTDVDLEDDEAKNVHFQIDAVKSYRGFDHDDTRRFNLATWREERIWDKVRPWLTQLG